MLPASGSLEESEPSSYGVQGRQTEGALEVSGSRLASSQPIACSNSSSAAKPLLGKALPSYLFTQHSQLQGNGERW